MYNIVDHIPSDVMISNYNGKLKRLTNYGSNGSITWTIVDPSQVGDVSVSFTLPSGSVRTVVIRRFDLAQTIPPTVNNIVLIDTDALSVSYNLNDIQINLAKVFNIRSTDALYFSPEFRYSVLIWSVTGKLVPPQDITVKSIKNTPVGASVIDSITNTISDVVEIKAIANSLSYTGSIIVALSLDAVAVDPDADSTRILDLALETNVGEPGVWHTDYFPEYGTDNVWWVYTAVEGFLTHFSDKYNISSGLDTYVVLEDTDYTDTINGTKRIVVSSNEVGSDYRIKGEMSIIVNMLDSKPLAPYDLTTHIYKGTMANRFYFDVPEGTTIESFVDTFIATMIVDVSNKTEYVIEPDMFNVTYNGKYATLAPKPEFDGLNLINDVTIYVDELVAREPLIDLNTVTNCDEPGVWEIDDPINAEPNYDPAKVYLNVIRDIVAVSEYDFPVLSNKDGFSGSEDTYKSGIVQFSNPRINAPVTGTLTIRYTNIATLPPIIELDKITNMAIPNRIILPLREKPTYIDSTTISYTILKPYSKNIPHANVSGQPYLAYEVVGDNILITPNVSADQIRPGLVTGSLTVEYVDVDAISPNDLPTEINLSTISNVAVDGRWEDSVYTSNNITDEDRRHMARGVIDYVKRSLGWVDELAPNTLSITDAPLGITMPQGSKAVIVKPGSNTTGIPIVGEIMVVCAIRLKRPMSLANVKYTVNHNVLGETININSNLTNDDIVENISLSLILEAMRYEEYDYVDGDVDITVTENTITIAATDVGLTSGRVSDDVIQSNIVRFDSNPALIQLSEVTNCGEPGVWKYVVPNSFQASNIVSQQESIFLSLLGKMNGSSGVKTWDFTRVGGPDVWWITGDNLNTSNENRKSEGKLKYLLIEAKPPEVVPSLDDVTNCGEPGTWRLTSATLPSATPINEQHCIDVRAALNDLDFAYNWDNTESQWNNAKQITVPSDRQIYLTGGLTIQLGGFVDFALGSNIDLPGFYTYDLADGETAVDNKIDIVSSIINQLNIDYESYIDLSDISIAVDGNTITVTAVSDRASNSFEIDTVEASSGGDL